MAIQSILHIRFSTNLEKYLVCPIINGRVNKKTFKDTILSIKKSTDEMESFTLSQEGRATLTRSNLSAKPNYIMSSFMLPTAIHNEFDKTNRIFFWNKGDNHIPLIG